MGGAQTPAADIPERVVEEAIAWSVRLDYSTPDAGTRRAFDDWLHAHDLHAAAWQRVQSLRGDFHHVPAELALKTLQSADARRRARGLNRRQALKALSVFGSAGLGAWLIGRHAPWQRLTADVSTGIGERRTLQLQDGSVVVLNTDSAVDTDLYGDRRLITLRRGEIMVTARADNTMARPFVVDTPSGRLQARDTRFVVRLGESDASVAVQAGTLALYPGSGTMPAIAQTDEHWLLARAGASRLAKPDYDVAGWADGVINARQMRMADLVAELARYRAGHIACDHRVADLRVTGVYQLDDTDRTLEFIEQTHPVRVVRNTPFWLSVEPAELISKN